MSRINMEKPKEKDIQKQKDAQKQRRASAEFAAGSLLVARDCSFSLDDYKTKLNNNVLVVGGSGTGKTRTIVTPNLMQAVGSYCISDPKGISTRSTVLI